MKNEEKLKSEYLVLTINKMVKIIILHSCALKLIYFYVKNYVEYEFLLKILPFQHGCMEGGQQNIADFFLYDKIVKFWR